VHEVGQVLDVGVAFFFDLGLVEVELDVQLDANGLGRLRSRSDFGYRLDNRLGNRSRGRLGAATEVHTDTDARRPLGVALVDVVLGFNAGTGVEVLGEVQLGTTAQVGEGGAVTATGTVLADALVG